jgi:hypothetical protein
MLAIKYTSVFVVQKQPGKSVFGMQQFQSNVFMYPEMAHVD